MGPVSKAPIHGAVEQRELDTRRELNVNLLSERGG